MFISKKKHNRIVAIYEKEIDTLRSYKKLQEDNQKNTESLVKILDKLSDKNNWILDTCVGSADIMAHLDDSVPRYVPDVIDGGKVIKQEATPVTILDENGKATYGLTKQKADKNKKYVLIEKS